MADARVEAIGNNVLATQTRQPPRVAVSDLRRIGRIALSDNRPIS